ncbi:MAG: extracellular solute-binding protein [Candidatus Dormibacteraeota bacterium]|nr:extracellular solute-binding protein [Candidatus Dormibacteraeota bacterium]
MASEIWKADINRRDFLRAGAVLGLGGTALWLAACGGGSTGAATTPKPIVYPKAVIDGDLDYFNWDQYLSPDVISGFEKHYNVKVNLHKFDNMSSMMAKLNAGIPYDITFPTMDYVDQMVKANALLPIEHAQLANWGEVPSYFNNPWYDPHALYSVPYAIWTTGIAWRTDMVSDSLAGSWNDIWTLAPKYSGKFFLLDDFQEVLGMSLLRLGYDVNSGNRGQLDKAVDEIRKIKPHLRNWVSNEIPGLLDGSVGFSHAWSGDVFQVVSQAAKPEIYRYETAKEGVPTGNDTFVIPKNAKHPGTALKFIDWMLAPENATTNVDFFGYPQVTTTGITAYQKLIDKFPFLSLTLDQAIHGLREIVPTGSKKQLWDSEWTKVKAG